MRWRPKNVVRMELKGADELSNALIAVPQIMRRFVLINAVTKASRIMRPPLRRATPKSKKKFGKQATMNPPGTMRKSTGIAIRKYKGGAISAAYIGHRWPKGAAAHLIELGTAVRQTKKGLNRGSVTPGPFFRPVFDTHKSQVNAVMQTELAAGIAAATKTASLKALKKTLRG